MYRLLILLTAAAAAPQDNSITYIKMQPPTEDPDRASLTLIENIPLPISTQDTSDIIHDSRQSTNGELEATESTEDSTLEESTETTEDSTVTETYQPKTTPKFKKAPPKFYSKLSYFEKPNLSSVSANLVERTSKRRFRSKCRCEKISNCPKLQITVPRCPEEYFLCCF